MALHFDIQINGGDIGNVYIRRLNKSLVYGVPSHYEFEVHLLPGPHRATSQTIGGTVQHLYEDGALALIGKVMAQAEHNSKIRREGRKC